MMSSEGLLLVISGPSGCGKGTVCELLKQRNPDVEAHIFRSVENVNLDTVIGWKTGGKKYSFLDRYDEEA